MLKALLRTVSVNLHDKCRVFRDRLLTDQKCVSGNGVT
jgi:hypothetical protein